MSRILFVTESLYPLGPAQQLIPLARELKERGDEVRVAVQRDNVRSESESGSESSMPFDVVPLLSLQCDVQYANAQRARFEHPISRANFRAIARLKELIREWRPDIIHAWCGSSLWLALVANQFSRRGPRQKLFYTELSLVPKKRWFHQYFENRCGSGLVASIVPHTSVKKHLINNGLVGRIEVVPNRIESRPLESMAEERGAARSHLRSILGLPANTKIAGIVAPLIARTRLKDLIFAADQLTVIRNDFHFVILGAGVHENRLRRFLSLTEAQDHVHFLGEPPDGRKCLGGLDVYWHSHLIEPQPMPMLAAMELGIPAISVFGAGTDEIIRHQQTGFAVNFGARDEFARWTKYLIEQTESAQQLAVQGQAFVRQQFAGESLFDSYSKIWNED